MGYGNRNSEYAYTKLRRPRKFNDVAISGPQSGYIDNVLTNKK